MTGSIQSTPQEREAAVRALLDKEDILTEQIHLLKKALGVAETTTSLVTKPTATNLRIVSEKTHELIEEVDLLGKKVKHPLTLNHTAAHEEKSACDRILANLALMRSSLHRLKEDMDDALAGHHVDHALDDSTRHYNDFVLSMVKLLGQAKALLHRYHEDVISE